MNLNKILLLIIVTIFSFKFGYSDEPEWYGNIKSRSFEIIGYGKSQDLNKAFLNAKKNIAEIIQIQITSEVKIKTSESTSGGINEVSNYYIKAKTNVVLNDLITLKKEKHSNIWYVAIMYENLPVDKKFVKKVSSYNLKPERQNRYLSKTLLISSINEQLGQTLNIKITRLNQLWYINYKDIFLPLSNFDFEKLFFSDCSNLISLEAIPSNVLHNGDSFYFKILSNLSGFVSIVDVYENGEVFIILNNQKVNKNKQIKFPTENSQIELVSSLMAVKSSTHDLYIVFISKDKIDLSRIQPATDEINTSEQHFKFNEVLNLMGKYDYCAQIIQTLSK